MDELMPNCFIIGAAKSGTTTLANLLKQSSQVYLPFAKEPHFFSGEDRYHRGTGWYRDTFYRKAHGNDVRLDASTSYLYWSGKVAPRLEDYDRDQCIKIIAVFRDPIQRACSMYWHMVRDNREHASFSEALAAEEQSFRDNFDSLYARGSQEHGLFRGGCYATLLRPFLESFPSDRIFLLLQEDLLRQPGQTTNAISKFLGIAPIEAVALNQSNLAAMPRSRKLHAFLFRPSDLPHRIIKLFTHHMPYETRYWLKNKVIRANLRPEKYPPMPSDLQMQLRDRYSGEIQHLERIMGRDLSHWLKISAGSSSQGT